MSPLTHHEILAVVAPFARRGRRVDLAASDRMARHIAFAPVEHPPDPSGRPALHETLLLEDVPERGWRLTRRLQVGDVGDGLQAVLHAEGADPGELLARIDAVDPARQVLPGDGWLIATSHRIDAVPTAARAPDGEPVAGGMLVVLRGAARIGPLLLALKVPAVSGISAEISIGPIVPDDPIELPDDLLAVLGWGWARLDPTSAGWTSTVGLRGRGAQRLHDAESRLRQAAEHVARTLAEPPRRFHERHLLARWRVTARRAVPLAASVGLVAAAAAVPSLGLAADSPIRMLIFNAPPLLLGLFFCLREMPRIELPPLPRPPPAGAWRDIPTRAPQPDRPVPGALDAGA
jgi:hypothetical protein